MKRGRSPGGLEEGGASRNVEGDCSRGNKRGIDQKHSGVNDFLGSGPAA